MSITSNFGKITGHRTFKTVLLILSLAVIAIVAYIAQPNNKPTSTHIASSTSSKGKTSNHHTSTTNTQSTNSNSAATTTSSASNKPSSNNTPTTGPCSSILTADQVKSVLGGSPSASANNGVTSQNIDITITTCAYSVGSNTAAVTEHKSNTPTGQHENDDQFGSSRPSGVTSVSGYGQNAYWQTSTGLNVLENNNWYVVNLSGNESSSEQLAKAAQL
jgi:hypothetical protein